MTVTTKYDDGESNLSVRTKLNQRVSGWQDVNDVTTIGTPIVLGAGSWVPLTNDGAGVFSGSQLPDNVTQLWDTATYSLDFSDIPEGSLVRVRHDVSVVTASPNTAIDVRIETFNGLTPIFALPMGNQTLLKSAGTVQLVGETSFYIGAGFRSGATDYRPEIQARADTNSTLVVNGWLVIAQVL